MCEKMRNKILIALTSNSEIKMFNLLFKFSKEKFKFIGLDLSLYNSHIPLRDEKLCSFSIIKIPNNTENNSLQKTIRLFKKIKPNAFLIVNDHSMIERGMMLVSQRLGIPVILIANGNIDYKTGQGFGIAISFSRLKFALKRFNNILKRYLYLGNVKYGLDYEIQKQFALINTIRYLITDIIVSGLFFELRGKYKPDFIFTYSEHDKSNIVLNNRFPEDKILTLGNPSWDLIHSKRRKLTEERNLFHENKKRKILFLPSSQVEHGFWTPNQNQILLNDLVEVFGGLKENKVIIKPHPNGDDGVIKKVFAKIREKTIFLNENFDLHEALSVVDVVVSSGFSTALIDSVFFKVPSIIYNPFNDAHTIPCIKFGVSLEATTKNDLQLAIELALDNQSNYRKQFSYNQKKFLQYHSANWKEPLARENMLKSLEGIIQNSVVKFNK